MSTVANEAEKAELMAAVPMLQDPVWRLNNLYKIVDKSGTVVPFVPTAEQGALIHAVYVLKQKRHAILKARQMGFSTLIELMIFDAAYFGENIQASIVDRTQPDAESKLETKVRFAFKQLGPLKERPTVDNDSEMSWPNGSTINAGKNARGGTNQWLHISEWGPIAHEDPKRSAEIKTGALPTAEQGVIIVETTFKGGKGGHLYELMKTAMETPEAYRTAKDFRFWFFPWYLDASYTLEGDPAGVSPAIASYLDDKEQELGFKFTPGQRLWYAKTKAEQGIFMFREYPTTPDEAFRAPVEGSVFGDAVSQVRAAGRIRPYEWDRSVPVFSVWDIGWGDSTSIWLVQLVGREYSWIWHTQKSGRTAAEMVQEMRTTGIPVAAHYLPHDAASKSPGEGKNYIDSLEAAGLVNIKKVPRCTSIWPGIDALRKIILLSWFRKGHVDDGIDALEAYHTKTAGSNGVIAEDPVHDWSSHSSSAARVFAEAIELGMVTTAAATRYLNQTKPLAPDGSMVNLDHVRQVREHSRLNRNTAHSGGIRL